MRHIEITMKLWREGLHSDVQALTDVLFSDGTDADKIRAIAEVVAKMAHEDED